MADLLALLDSYRQKLGDRDAEIVELHKLLAQRTRERDEAQADAMFMRRELDQEIDE